jgi:hypothetical protein
VRRGSESGSTERTPQGHVPRSAGSSASHASALGHQRTRRRGGCQRTRSAWSKRHEHFGSTGAPAGTDRGPPDAWAPTAGPRSRARSAGECAVLDRRSVEGHCGDTSVSAGRARRLHARTVGSRRERDAPAPAGPPRTHRYPSGDWLGERDEGAMRRIVAYRGRRSGRHPRHARPPSARREAAHRSWATTTRPDERRPHGRGGRREVTPLDRARLDGSCPAGGDGGAVRETPPIRCRARVPERAPERRAPNEVCARGRR